MLVESEIKFKEKVVAACYLLKQTEFCGAEYKKWPIAYILCLRHSISGHFLQLSPLI